MENMIKNNKDKYKKVIGVFALQTDGHDNQSNQYSILDLKEKIKAIEELGIVCIFLASNQNAINTGRTYGFKAQNSLGLSATSSSGAYRSLSHATSRYASVNNDSFENEYDGFTEMERESSLGPNVLPPLSLYNSGLSGNNSLPQPPPLTSTLFGVQPTLSVSEDKSDSEYDEYDIYNP